MAKKVKHISEIRADVHNAVASRLPVKSANTKMNTNKLELLITVVNRKKSEF